MSGWRMRSSSASRATMSGMKSPFKRSNSSDNLRSSGIPISRQSRTPGTIRGETPLRSRMAPSSTIKKNLMTPLNRNECKSPGQLKSFYSNVDENGYLTRIKKYLLKIGSALEITKPVRINDFVAISQLFLSELCGPSFIMLTAKNYKTELPLRMKMFNYPIAISQSFLKTPNTPQNFKHVLSIWGFLLDLTEECSSQENDLDEIQVAMIAYLHKIKDHDVDECQAELEAKIYEAKGINKEEFISQKNELKAEIEGLMKEEAHALNELQDLQVIYDTKVKELNNISKKHNKTMEQLQTLPIDKQNAKIELNLNKERLSNLLRQEKEKTNMLKHVEAQIKEIGHTPDELKTMESELEKKQRRYEMLNSRYEESQARMRSLQNLAMEERTILEKMVFQHNTKVSLDIPENERSELYLNENEINSEQILLMETKVMELISSAQVELKQVNVILQLRCNEMVEFERNLEDKNETLSSMQNLLESKSLELKDLQQKLEMLKEDRVKLDKELKKIHELTLIAIERAGGLENFYKTEKEETTKYLNQMKEECIRTQNVIKEKFEEIVQKRAQVHAAVKAKLVKAKEEIKPLEEK